MQKSFEVSASERCLVFARCQEEMGCKLGRGLWQRFDGNEISGGRLDEASGIVTCKGGYHVLQQETLSSDWCWPGRVNVRGIELEAETLR